MCDCCFCDDTATTTGFLLVRNAAFPVVFPTVSHVGGAGGCLRIILGGLEFETNANALGAGAGSTVLVIDGGRGGWDLWLGIFLWDGVVDAAAVVASLEEPLDCSVILPTSSCSVMVLFLVVFSFLILSCL